MQQVFLLKWLFCGFIITLRCLAFQASESLSQSGDTIENDPKETVDWTGLITDLRDSWQSPLYYLKKRGYLPPGNENLLEQKLNELRGIKINEHNFDEFGEKADENMEELPNAFSASSSVLSSAEPGSIDSVEDANCNQAIITSGSQQQEPQDSTDILFKELSVDMRSDADSNTETDRDSEEDLGSLKNNIANACAKKPSTAATKSKSKSKLKCKSKTKPKSKPGFFQRLKESFSSIFKKPQAANSKEEQIKKPALSSDYANYFVKYLAHRDMNTDANNLSVNDLNSRYVGIKSSRNSERVGKGLHRREYNSKDLNSKVSTCGDLSDKEISLQTKNDIAFEKFSDEATGKKDSVLKEFPFQDFNFGDLNLKKLSTKDIRSNNKADDQFSDLENFKSKDEEVNKIVHSLAEQHSTAKDPFKNEKWETKGDSSLKELALPKDSENLLLENNKLIHEDYKDHNVKEIVPIIAGKSIEEVIGNGKKEISSKNEVSNELTASSFSMRRPNFDAKDDTSKLLGLKNFDFSFPDLNLRSLASTSKDIISKDNSFDDFANLGMSSLKMKVLESDGEEIDTPTDIESSGFAANEDISKESDVNEYGVRKSDDTSLNIKSHNVRVATGLAEAKQTKINGFVLGDLSAISDKNNLDLDRQFTRQVLEKVMRSTVQERELDKQ
ncbi:uncharacterized protein LOC126756313 [Bactrocera neohumeralis]|uniref:uncharacterized protein LOC126756313 n=1 Tax=Bactrocera neohumeralis TaxID=98809 RepID=UPI00216561CB|nr:uncharacterized protein LOC126756313 [Bactrocera neohumeralis]